MMKFESKDGLLESAYWLVRLRWFAIIGVILTILYVDKIVRIPLPIFAISVVAVFLGLYNGISQIYLNLIIRRKPAELDGITSRFTNLQISIDLFFLAALLHFSGGIENPFIFYFIFHMIIASTLLKRRDSYLQVTFTILLFAAIVATEYLGILTHYHLDGFGTSGLYRNKIYIGGVSFVFVSTLYIAAYMATSIAAKLREREKSLEEANLLLKEKDRIKSEYVLRVSHDIKEHLSAIQGCLEPVIGGVTGDLSSAQKDLIRRANERTDKLAFFVKALLEVTRLKLSKEVDMGLFSLKRTIEGGLSFVETKAKDKNIEIKLNIDPGIDMIRGAQVYIEETVANILANAVKYTYANGKINVEVKDKGGLVLISVSDTGIGIPQDELPRIFEEFFRARNARYVLRDGTGLGLSIAKQVIERHKGKIWVESKENQGSTFYIELPK